MALHAFWTAFTILSVSKLSSAPFLLMIFIPDSPFHFIVLAELSVLRTTAVACFSLLSILLKNTADLQVRAFTGRPQACTFQLLIVFLVVYTVCFFQNYTEILSDLDIL